MSNATMRWWLEFREMEKIRPIVEAALAASDGGLRKRFGLPPASRIAARSDTTQGGVAVRQEPDPKGTP